MFAVDPVDLAALAAFVHVLVLAPALGCALAADAIAISTVFRPLGPRALKILRRFHTTILCALIVMWISGLTMVAAKLMPGGDGVSPKLVAKLFTVILLSINALAIGRIALPLMRETGGQTFARFPDSVRLKLGVIGGLSSACWLSALALGTVAALQPMGYGSLAVYLGPVFVGGLLAGLLLAIAAPRLAIAAGGSVEAASIRSH